MKIGFNMPQLTAFASRRAVHEFAVRADELGYDSLWVQDHLLYPEQPIQSHPIDQFIHGPEPIRQWPEAYESLLAPLESLAYVAGITKNIRVGTSVLVFGYHRPVALAKQIATIDMLSEGRFDLGIGIGWARDEYAHMETPFEKLGARCSDFIRALRAAWKPNPTEYSGGFYTIPRGSTSPKPVQQDEHGNPAVPILGGFLSESGIVRVAELCDAWHPAGHTVEMAVTRMQQINHIAKEQFNRGPLKLVHRVFAAPALPSVKKIGDQAMQPNWTGTPDAMLPHLKECKEAGIDEVVIDTSFFKEMASEDDWIAHPDFFKPLLDEAHR